MPPPEVITLTPPGRSTASLPRLSSCTTSPSNSHVTVCRPMCGCGATSIGLPSVNDSGPKRSRKHHGPISRLSFTGSARHTLNEPTASSRLRNDCRSRPSAPSAVHASADTCSLRFDIADRYNRLLLGQHLDNRGGNGEEQWSHHDAEEPNHAKAAEKCKEGDQLAQPDALANQPRTYEVVDGADNEAAP